MSNLYAGIAGYVGRAGQQGLHGVFSRQDGANHWDHVLKEYETYTVNVHPTDPTVVFAGTADGVYRSTDSGRSFKRAAFPGKTQIWSFLVDAGNPDLVYAGASPIAMYRSEDRGESWRELPNPGMPDRAVMPFACRVMRLAQHPSQPGTLYAALSVAAASKDGALYRSTDKGETWSRFDKVQVHGTIMSVALHQNDPNQVYLGARYDGEVYGTVDGGDTWSAMPLPSEVKDIYSLAVG